MNIYDFKRIWLAGNGGSAANAIHIANDLVSCGLSAIALTADIATLTAIANDYSYEEVFSRQIHVHGQKGDLLVLLSGSGSSPNILRAASTGRARCMFVYAITGTFGKNEVLPLADRFISHGATMQEAEEYQLKWGHQWLLKNRG